MKSTFVLCLSLFFASVVTAYAQTGFDPSSVESIVLKAKADYATHEPTLIEAARWLESTPLDQDTDNRMRVNGFVLQYVSGTPAVTVSVNKALVDLSDKNPDLLAIYLASYARHTLEKKGSATSQSATRAGLLSMINVYKKGVKIERNKKMDKVAKMSDEEIDKYVTGTLMKA